jgi:hypothetical protein
MCPLCDGIELKVTRFSEVSKIEEGGLVRVLV